MSTSAAEHAENLETAARLARAVSARFPKATWIQLWADGPRVFVADDIEANRIDLIQTKDGPLFYTYVEVLDGRDRARVYEGRRWEHSARLLFDVLLKDHPEVYAAIVKKAGTL